MFRLTMVTLIAALASGCAGTAYMGDRAEISGTPEGLRAMFDGLNGSMKTAKEAPDAQNQYLTFRSVYEQYKNQKQMKGGS